MATPIEKFIIAIKKKQLRLYTSYEVDNAIIRNAVVPLQPIQWR